MNINPKEIKRQYDRIKKDGWLPWFQQAAKRSDTSTAHFLAIGSRETNLKNIRGDFRNGRWNGFGVMQVDIGTDASYAKNWTPAAVEPSIRRGGEIYSSKVDQIISGQGKRLTVRGHKFTGKRADADDVRRIATAAYNSGLWPFYHFSRGEHVDSTTTGKDYSRDVYDRAIEFADLLEKDGIEPGALRREVELQGKYAKASAQKRAGVAETPDAHVEMGDEMEDQSVLVATDYRDDEPQPETSNVVAGPIEEKSEAVSGKAKVAENDPVRVAPTNPPVVEVKSAGLSLPTKIAAATGPIGTALTALGIKFGGIQITQGTVYALCAVAIVAILASAWIYKTGKDREQERLKLSMNNLADPERRNVVAASTSGNGV